MRSFVHSSYLALVFVFFSVAVFAQEKTQAYYNTHESEILPDANAAFREGNYERTIQLCTWHYVFFGTRDAESLQKKAEQCAQLAKDMDALYAEGKRDEALKAANSLLSINPDDPKAKRIQEELTIVETPLAIEEIPEAPIEDTIAIVLPPQENEMVEQAVQNPMIVSDIEPVQVVDNSTKSSTLFTLLNSGYSLDSSINAGVTIGQLGRIGWYAKAMSTFALPQSVSYECDEWGAIDGIMPAYTGMASTFKAYGIAGLVVGVGGPVYLQAGLGYGCRMYDWELTDGSWVRNIPGSYSGLAIDAGLMAAVGKVVLSAGATYLSNTFDMCFGIGFRF